MIKIKVKIINSIMKRNQWNTKSHHSIRVLRKQPQIRTAAALEVI